MSEERLQEGAVYNLLGNKIVSHDMNCLGRLSCYCADEFQHTVYEDVILVLHTIDNEHSIIMGSGGKVEGCYTHLRLHKKKLL